MRLTLRTLLSYLDNVLDEPSRAELQRQIEASEHASEWVHRTRDVMRRLRLGAPEPGGTGSIDDPNTVAEYLDRTLPEEGVAEFERVCLESDAMLAEVASCHHVLAMFLSEPAEIDPDTRNRLHRLEADLATALKARAENAARQAAAVQPAAIAPVIEPPPARRMKVRQRRAEVEEESGGFWSDLVPWIPAIAALLLLSATAYLVLNNETTAPVAKSPNAAVEEEGAVDDEGDASSDAATEGDDSEGVADDATAAAEGDEDAAEADQATVEEADPVKPNSLTETPAADATKANEETTPAEPATNPTTTPEVEATTSTVEEPGAKPPVGNPPPEPSPMESEGEEDAATQPADEESEPKASLTYYGDPPAADAPRVGPASRKDPNGFVVVEAEGGVWNRLQQGMFMESPQKGHVISLPAYRGAFELSQGVLIELVDQTEAVIDPEKPSVELLYGRVVLTCFPDAKESVEVAVRIDAIDYTLTLKPGARVAIAADRFFEPGRPMLSDPAPMVAIAHALGGESSWKTSTSERTSAMPAPLFFVSGSLSGAPTGFRDPAWVTAVEMSDADLESSPYVAGQVTGVVLPQLLALADAQNSRETRDVVSLAGRCSAALMQPDALVASFGDKAQADEWQRHLDVLRQMASRSARGADAVQQAFVEKFGSAGGGALFEVVQGFTPAQVGGDATAVQGGVIPGKLLPMLESEDLATRVLGSMSLFELIESRPVDKDVAVGDRADRRKFIRRVERDIERGELPLLSR
jgi:hypothetical protein